MARHKKSRSDGKSSTTRSLDYHEGLSSNQVEIILRSHSLDHLIDEFNEWLYGQTSPIVIRYNKEGKEEKIVGVYEYDLFRWIESKRTGIAPVFD